MRAPGRTVQIGTIPDADRLQIRRYSVFRFLAWSVLIVHAVRRSDPERVDGARPLIPQTPLDPVRSLGTAVDEGRPAGACPPRCFALLRNGSNP